MSQREVLLETLYKHLDEFYKLKDQYETEYQKDLEKQQYVMEKIKNYKINKLKAHQQLITGLPQWENEYS